MVDPDRYGPVLVRDDLVNAGRIGSIRGQLFKFFAEFSRAEENPMVLVSAVELILKLADGVKHPRKIVVMSQCYQRCTRWYIGHQGIQA